MQNSWGIDTDEVEENSSCETEYNGWCSTGGVNDNPLASGEEAGRGNRDILLQSKADIDLRANGPEIKDINYDFRVANRMPGMLTSQTTTNQR